MYFTIFGVIDLIKSYEEINNKNMKYESIFSGTYSINLFGNLTETNKVISQ